MINALNQLTQPINCHSLNRMFLMATALLWSVLSSNNCFAYKASDSGGLSEKMQQYVQPFLANKEFEGYIIVQSKGETLLSQSFSGSATFTDQSPFMIGSITKTFTAALVQKLIEEGRLSLKTPLSDFNTKIDKADQITIRHLLTHRSGIPDYYNIDEFREARYSPKSASDFMDWISQFPLDFEPGKGNNYSNSGYLVLAYIIELLNGMPYEQYLKNALFTAMGMGSSGSLEKSTPDDLVQGFEPGPAPDMLRASHAIHPDWLRGNGSVYATPSDLLKWGESVKTKLQNEKKWRPYGWGIRKRGKEQFIEQNGRIPGYSSSLRFYPESDLIVLALSRIESDAITSLTEGISEIALGADPAVPETRVLVELSPEQLKEYDGVYRIAPNFFVTVRAEVNGLGIATGKGEGLHFAALDPLGNDEFHFRVGNATVSFVKKDGEVKGLKWAGSGPFPKVD